MIHPLPLLRCCVFGLAIFQALSARGEEANAQPEFSREALEHFETHVRPLLVTHCYECHSGESLKGGLSLTSRTAMLRGGDSGPAIVPGDITAGELLSAVEYDPAGYQMPPAGKLSEVEIQHLRQWIAAGAAWPAGDATDRDGGSTFDLAARAQHWSFQPLQRPPVPDVENSTWCRTPIDRFVLSQLEAENLHPAEAADRATWLRRVSFDVLGLPPSPRELAEFLADTSPDAFERVIDRLLASPHFGERWGRHWLDLVRYAESRGHEFDFNVANPWHYRDYVIRAINEDVPYDQFVAEHVAGDLLTANAAQLPLRVDPFSGRNESILGTGFWFLGEWVHSPVDIRQEEADRFDNMIDVYSRTFLGLTVACARCHDHKFDPILQQDFYALQGYLQSSSYRQVRFETIVQEEHLSDALIALRSEAGPVLLKAFAELAEPTANDVDKYFLAAQAILEEGVTLKSTAVEHVVADFESGTYEGWQATGDAFGAEPQSLATIPAYQGKINATGTYFVNSHQTRNGGRGDAATGTLTSAEFLIDLPYLRFWVGGGAHAGKTCVNLLIDDQPARTQTGRSDNQMYLAEWDVRELIGKQARLQIVDNEQGGWGNIGADNFVLTAHALEGTHRVTPDDFAEEMHPKLVKHAREYGVHVGTLKEWVAELASPHTADDVLSRFLAGQARESDVVQVSSETPGPETVALEQLLLRDDVFVVTDFRTVDTLITDGPLFRSGRRQPGEAILALSGPQPVVALEDVGGVSRDSFWDDLTVSSGTIGDPGNTENWQRGGRTLHTATFEITQPRIYALVKGGCRSYANVDSHITIRGPLHGSLTREHPVQNEWHWIEHDVERYLGHRAHLEFVPVDRQPLTVALVVQSAPSVPLPDVRRVAPTSMGQTQAERANQLRLAVELAIHYCYGDSKISRHDSLMLAMSNWLLTRPELVGVDADNREVWNQLAEPYRQRYRELNQRRPDASATAPAFLAATPEDEYVFVRGNWKKRGVTAPRSFLTVFQSEPKDAAQMESTRLALAQQMVDSSRTPVTARVIVNRIWQHYFGRGIVATPDDLGHLGQAPSHPELLDWLASELVRHDWSQKHIHRLILASATYRMSSRQNSEELYIVTDPDNILLHRMNIKRLEGEVIRDGMLAISGRFAGKMYGPSVPIHLTPFLDGRGRPESGPVDGGGRRSVYLSVRRNFAEPFFQAFDFPVPHTTIGRRSVSNVPAQALALMNNEMVIGQSQVWAERVLREQERPEQRVGALYLDAFSRLPTETEQRDALSFVAAQAEEYQSTIDDLRPWSDLCQVLWNGKEFVFLQ